jgi:uncharacterized protein involved in outer membrane biogenesis
LTYSTGKPRPKLEGDVASRQLRLADLGPLIGVNAAQKPPEASNVKARLQRSLPGKCCRTIALTPINGS